MSDRNEEITPRFIDRAAFGLDARITHNEVAAFLASNPDVAERTERRIYTGVPPVQTCGECGHPAGAHANVTNDGCFIEECLCERTELTAWYGLLHDERDPASPFADLEDENADLRMALNAASAELARLRDAARAVVDATNSYVVRDAAIRKSIAALRASLDGKGSESK